MGWRRVRHHDGLLDQGEAEVITYDSITGTPDHEVFTDQGKITLESARESGATLRVGVSRETWTRLRLNAQVVKDRCTNPHLKNFQNYGGRGITFEFATGSDMAEWVLRNLGPPRLARRSIE